MFSRVMLLYKEKESFITIAEPAPWQGSVTITGTVPIDATGNITVNIRKPNTYVGYDFTGTAPVSNGTYSVSVSVYGSGYYYVEAIYSGDSKYMNSSNTSFITTYKNFTIYVVDESGDGTLTKVDWILYAGMAAGEVNLGSGTAVLDANYQGDTVLVPVYEQRPDGRTIQISYYARLNGEIPEGYEVMYSDTSTSSTIRLYVGTLVIE